jgi:hypothetical protein
MNRNFYIYKNRISSENIEDGLEVNSLIKSIDNFIIKQKVSSQFYQTPQIKDWEGMSREEKQEIYDLAKRSKPSSQLSDQEKKDIMDLTIDTGYRPPPFRGKVKKKMDNSELSGENIEKANLRNRYEGQGNPSDDYSRLSSENQKKVDEIWRKIGKLESAYGIRKPSKTENETLNPEVKKQDVALIPDTYDEYDDFSDTYDEPRAQKLSFTDKKKENQIDEDEDMEESYFD